MKIVARYDRIFICCVGTILTTIIGCTNNPQIDSDTGKQEVIVEEAQIINTIYQQKESLNLCNEEQDKDLSSDSAKVYQLNEQEYLGEILCFLGAYQPNYQYFFVIVNSNSELEIKPIFFTTFRAKNKDLQLTDTRTLTGITNFELETKSLIIETKGRGLGDCGSFAVYQWENNNFNLKEYRYKGNCDGVYLNPEDYPLIYP